MVTTARAVVVVVVVVVASLHDVWLQTAGCVAPDGKLCGSRRQAVWLQTAGCVAPDGRLCGSRRQAVSAVPASDSGVTRWLNWQIIDSRSKDRRFVCLFVCFIA